MNRKQNEQKEKSISVATLEAHLSRRIVGKNNMSYASPHKSSAAGGGRESFVQVFANI